MGDSRIIYWFSYFVINYAMFLIMGVVLFILVPSLNLRSFTGPAFFPLVLVIMLYIPSMILLSYCLSFLFDKTETAQRLLPSLINLLGFGPLFFIFFLDSVYKNKFIFMKVSNFFLFCIIEYSRDTSLRFFSS